MLGIVKAVRKCFPDSASSNHEEGKKFLAEPMLCMVGINEFYDGTLYFYRLGLNWKPAEV